MGRKSKQAGGNFPLTHYERTKKFISSEYGTTQQRLAGYSQYQLGYCALTISRIIDTDTNSITDNTTTTDTSTSSTSIAMCTPSGYLYCKQAIIEYLLLKTSEYNDTIRLQEATTIQQQQQNINTTLERKRQQEELLFDTSQQLVVANSSSNKKLKSNNEQQQQTNLVVYNNNDEKINDKNDLQRTSYWLPSSSSNQNNKESTTTTTIEQSQAQLQLQSQPQRPSSPCSGQYPLRRKDVWPVRLQWNNTTNDNSKVTNTSDMYVCCAISDKRIQTQSAIAYWTIDTKKNKNKNKNKDSSKTSIPTLPGIIVLESIYNELIQPTMICPLSNRSIYTTRIIQSSGTSYASSKQGCTGTQYRPTIT